MAVNIPNAYKIFYHFSFQGPPNYTHFGIFFMKTYHLATLDRAHHAVVTKLRCHLRRNGYFDMRVVSDYILFIILFPQVLHNYRLYVSTHMGREIESGQGQGRYFLKKIYATYLLTFVIEYFCVHM
jgi:hypothetical protein